MLKANLIFDGYKIHEKAQEGNESSEQFAANFRTACKGLCLMCGKIMRHRIEFKCPILLCCYVLMKLHRCN